MLYFLFILLTAIFHSDCVVVLLNNKSTTPILPISFSSLLEVGISSRAIAPGASITVEIPAIPLLIGYAELNQHQPTNALRTQRYNLMLDGIKELLANAHIIEMQWVDSTDEIRNSTKGYLIEEPWVIFTPSSYETVYLKVKKVS